MGAPPLSPGVCLKPDNEATQHSSQFVGLPQGVGRVSLGRKADADREQQVRLRFLQRSLRDPEELEYAPFEDRP